MMECWSVGFLEQWVLKIEVHSFILQCSINPGIRTQSILFILSKNKELIANSQG